MRHSAAAHMGWSSSRRIGLSLARMSSMSSASGGLKAQGSAAGRDGIGSVRRGPGRARILFGRIHLLEGAVGWVGQRGFRCRFALGDGDVLEPVLPGALHGLENHCRFVLFAFAVAALQDEHGGVDVVLKRGSPAPRRGACHRHRCQAARRGRSIRVRHASETTISTASRISKASAGSRATTACIAASSRSLRSSEVCVRWTRQAFAKLDESLADDAFGEVGEELHGVRCPRLAFGRVHIVVRYIDCKCHDAGGARR